MTTMPRPVRSPPSWPPLALAIKKINNNNTLVPGTVICGLFDFAIANTHASPCATAIVSAIIRHMQ
jgi:hypothetical protein